MSNQNKNIRKRDRSIALIGLGPHAKRIYLHYLNKYKENLALVIDLESNKISTKKYLDENGFKNTKIFCIDDKYKDFDELPDDIANSLLLLFSTFNITHILISTEPKAHNMYLNFALKNNINVLTDKPITVVKNMTSKRSISKVRSQYYNILKLASNSSADCKVMCQRQYHRGYEYIKKILTEVVKKYQVPITYIDIYHCDGNWEMMHDLNKENHPYKYGYGKLFHSGYHFIDLLSDLLKINNQLPELKRIKYGEVYSNFLTPNDEKAIISVDDYKRLFKEQEIPDYYNMVSDPEFKNYGEKNFYSLMKFTNLNHQLITEVNLNLLHYGFSRRAWIKSKNYYKENGRIRHERVNIQVGPLMNIQIHSYQSKEIKDRTDLKSEENIGGLEHFEIHIYRNCELIGGKPFEKINLGDLYNNQDKQNILGYNELSREEYLHKFLNGNCPKGDIRNQELAIEILYSCAMGLHNYYHNIKKPVSIKIPKYNDIISISNLKSIKTKSIDLPKILVDTCEVLKDNCQMGVVRNYIDDMKCYEIYLYIQLDKKVVSNLMLKTLKSKHLSYLYYKLIVYYVKNNSEKNIINKILKKQNS